MVFLQVVNDVTFFLYSTALLMLLKIIMKLKQGRQILLKVMRLNSWGRALMYTRCEGEAMTKIVRKWITLCCLESSLQEQLHTGSCQHLGSYYGVKAIQIFLGQQRLQGDNLTLYIMILFLIQCRSCTFDFFPPPLEHNSWKNNSEKLFVDFALHVCFGIKLNWKNLNKVHVFSFFNNIKAHQSEAMNFHGILWKKQPYIQKTHRGQKSYNPYSKTN